jgi:arylsulfatase A-like enzyme
MKQLHRLVVVALALAAWGAACAKSPNILLIVADDLGYADVGVHGGREFATPHIDSIAQNGIRFTSGYVSAPVCAPSRAGFLTGRYHDRFGFQGNPAPGAAWGLPLTEKTIADRLKGAGYRTAVFGKWHLGENPEYHPQKRGFDEFFGFLSGMHDYFKSEDPRWGRIMRGREPAELKEYLTFAIAREGCRFIGEQKAQPFFLYLSFNAPHLPLQAPDEYSEKTAAIADPQRRKYAAMVMALDDAIGRVLLTLREGNLEKDTVIFFLSDNGGPLIAGSAVNGAKNDPLRGSKLELWEGGVRVPFFVQGKGRLPGGRVVDVPIISLDILPTALALAGVEVAPGWKLDGLNLLPLLEGRTTELPREGLFWGWANRDYAVRQGDWKLVKVKQAGGLFDLRTDVGESVDRTAERGQLAKELKSRWDRWSESNAKVNLRTATKKTSP